MGIPRGKVGRALIWIEGVLDRLEVPRQYVGGLAARAWGGTRPVDDIDIYVPDEALPRIADALTAYLVRYPVLYEDDDWNRVYMRADYQGQGVEIAGCESARYHDRQTAEWQKVGVDFDAGVHREVDGVEIPVMPVRALVAYKVGLDREVDRVDVEELQGMIDSGLIPEA